MADHRNSTRRGTSRLHSRLAVAGLIAAILCSSQSGANEQSRLDFFEKKIRPVLSKHCFGCHSAAAAKASKLKGGLRLDSRAAALRGGDSGRVIVPGKPDESLLLGALRYNDLEMPPSGRLPDRVIADFGRWIEDGAAWPDDAEAPANASKDLSDYDYWRANHWSWRPLATDPPEFTEPTDWSRNPIDRFIYRRLRRAKFAPAAEADPTTLARRLYFDLLGLPPTYNDVADFMGDDRPGAYERLVDRLLASPAYGERWGRHWLDVARYADNGGFNSQTPQLYTDFPFAYSYRDYVVRALNDDLPYDRFVIEQLAADRLDLGDDNRALAALGLLTLGDKSFGTSRDDRIDDCIDTVTQGFLGITVSCARCHDHKYDPVPTADYYSLHGVFANSNIDVASRLHTREKSEVLPVLFRDAADRKDYEARVANANESLKRAREQHTERARQHCRERLADYLLAAADRADDRRKKGLNEQLTKRWADYLKKAGAQHPLFGAWLTFSQLPRDASREKLAGTLKQLAQAGPNQAPVHATLLTRLQQQPLKSLADIAEVYADVLSKPNVAAEAKDSPLNLDQDTLLKLPIHGGLQKLKSLREQLSAAKYSQPRAVAAKDRDKPGKSAILIRGNPKRRGQAVPRQFLALLSTERTAFTDGSGRLELAQSIVGPARHLTARVIVNRLWHHHFGRGLAENTSDFGTRSDPPSHPALLDYLATELIRDRWSLKRLHRRIVLSQTYRQASEARANQRELDPDNVMLARMARRRLGFEAVRDSLLAASGELDRRVGGEPVQTWKSTRRTLYGYIDRYRIAAGYTTFDFPSPSRTSPKRNETLVPQQSLFLMNAPYVEARAGAVVARPDFTTADDDEQRLRLLYRWILSRDPRPAEAAASLEFVGSAQEVDPWQQLAHALFLSNEFVYVD